MQREILLHGRGFERTNPIVLTKQVMHSSVSRCQAQDSMCCFATRLDFSMTDSSVPRPRFRRTHGGSCWSTWTSIGRWGALTRCTCALYKDRVLHSLL